MYIELYGMFLASVSSLSRRRVAHYIVLLAIGKPYNFVVEMCRAVEHGLFGDKDIR